MTVEKGSARAKPPTSRHDRYKKDVDGRDKSPAMTKEWLNGVGKRSAP
jgi:hypothetical protein